MYVCMCVCPFYRTYRRPYKFVGGHKNRNAVALRRVTDNNSRLTGADRQTGIHFTKTQHTLT